MTDLQSIPILEATESLQFTSAVSLCRHVIKHVLDARDERWSQLIDADQIAAARDEVLNDSNPKPVLSRLMGQYFRIGKDALVKLCGKDLGHQHLYWEPSRISDARQSVATKTLPDDAVQTIEAVEVDRKIVIIAKSFVRNGKFGAYKMCSIYRPFPKLSGNSLKKNTQKQLRERETLPRNTVVLAHHDDLSFS